MNDSQASLLRLIYSSLGCNHTDWCNLNISSDQVCSFKEIVFDSSGSGFTSAKPVGCSINGTIDSLVLPFHGDLLGNESLSGTVPTELALLTGLTAIDVRSGTADIFKLRGTLPSQLCELVNLTAFHLAHTHVSGTLPTQLARLSALKRIALPGNDLSGTIPTQVYALTNLVSLRFGYNQLSGPLNATLLYQLSRLTYLGIGPNQLQGTLPTQLGLLSTLQLLFAASNKFSGTLPSELFALPMRQIFLSKNRLSGTVPSEIAQNAFEKLRFQQNNLNGVFPNVNVEANECILYNAGATEKNCFSSCLSTNCCANVSICTLSTIENTTSTTTLTSQTQLTQASLSTTIRSSTTSLSMLTSSTISMISISVGDSTSFKWGVVLPVLLVLIVAAGAFVWCFFVRNSAQTKDVEMNSGANPSTNYESSFAALK